MHFETWSPFLLMMSTLWCPSTCFHYGPPATTHVCKNMFPEGHHVDSQTTEPPFEIMLSQNVYTSWEEIQVTLKAKPGHYFRGFFMQARRADCTHRFQYEPLGTFTVLPGDITLLKTLPCFNNKDSAVSHRTNESLAKAVFRWNAPAAQIGHIFFVATVVKERELFWTNVRYVFLRDLSNKESRAEFCPTKSYIDPPDINTTPDPTVTTDRLQETTTCGCPSVTSSHLVLELTTLALLSLKRLAL